MMRYIVKNLLPISIVASGILVSVSIWYRFNLDVLQKVFSIAGSLSLGIALAAYLTKKKQDGSIAAIEQIAFFRKEIIPKYKKIIEEIKRKNENYVFSRIKLDRPTIEFIREKYPVNFERHASLFLNDLSGFNGGSLLSDQKFLDEQIELFNMLEEFSLRANHFGTEQHKALDSVRAAFVEIIEQNAVALIFVRDVINGSKIYSTTLSLYNTWKDSVNKVKLIKKLEENGFITKEQREELYKKKQNFFK